MVMRKNVTGKNLLRTIKNSFGRYLAIMLIIALGASMFVGLLSTKTDMVATGQKFLDEQNMFDLLLLSTYGWTQKEVDAIRQMAGVADAEGQIGMDAIVYYGEDAEGSVYQLHAIPQRINQVYLLGGRMPTSPNECLVDGFHVGDEVLGTKITIAGENNEETLESMAHHSFTVVGYVSTPLYMDMSRGSTNLGNGSVAGYLYFMPEAFSMDVFTEIAVTMEADYAIYSDAFAEALEQMAEELEPHVTILANDRFASVKDEAEQEYADGLLQYEEGLSDFEEGRETALQELAQALEKLESAQQEIDDNRVTMADGYAKLEDAQAQLDEQAALLMASRQELTATKANTYQQLAAAYAELSAQSTQITEGLAQIEEGLAQIDAGLVQIDEGITQIEDGLAQIEEGLVQLELGIALQQAQVVMLEASIVSMENSLFPIETVLESLKQQLAQAQEQLDALLKQKEEALAMQEEYSALKEQLQQQRQQLLNQREELLQTQIELNKGMELVQVGMLQLQSNQARADAEFAAAEAQIEAGQLQMDGAQAEIDASRAELDAATAALNDAQAELDLGWAEYEEGRIQAEQELAQAEQELLDAAAKLEDARETIDSLEPAEVYILDRNTNAGYIALDNNSDIVSGVSRVFPAFFLLVAALVCITTMTRMVEEERTQIGTMKALGYSNWQIISKYIFYAGSAAVLGCGLGTILGSVVFPTILWNAYKIILNIRPNIVLKIDWALCGVVVLVYTVVMLVVTWYCCRRTLREVPAELIRAKPPTSGKKILLEYFPFWKRFSFLNKVMLRNVFRYRQRMLMMLVGVGGCTALLLTGFGLRDSLVNIATDQFEKVTVYDLSVYFSGNQDDSQQKVFADELGHMSEREMFFYQTSVELDYAGSVRELYMIVSNENVKEFIYFTENGQQLGMPGLHEAFLSAGMAENLGIATGDTVLLRDADMRSLEVMVTGIYDNMVSNYIVITPETYLAQVGTEPGYQMAFVNVAEYLDVHEVAAKIGAMEGVMSVMICQDTAQQVTSMLDALDLVVITVVICAGALAVIVLYNLTNINITERIREIATIKVLGFHSMESAMYVFKENLLLTGFGVVVGMLVGKYLLAFVVSQIKVDIVFFEPQISLFSCILAVILTVLSAVLVDFLLYFMLEKINMAEALKSVE